MVTIDIKENIRFFKPNDPYYYEVDNLPLIDLLNNDKILRDEINFILAANSNYASEAFVITNLQAAIGDAGEVDIDGDGITPAFTDLISWINAQGYLTEVATSIGDLLDVDTTTVSPSHGNTLIYDSTLSPPQWVAGGQQRQGIQYLPQRYFIVGQEKTGSGSDSHSLGFTNATDRSQDTLIAWQKNWGSKNSRSTSDHFCMDSYQGFNFKGSNDGHTTFTWSRRFTDIGLPDNTKRIYCHASIQSYALTDTGIVNEDTWQYFQHSHGGPEHGPMPGPTNGHAYILDGYVLPAVTIKEIRTEKMGLSYTNLKTFNYIIEYRTPLRDFGSTNHTNFASNTPNSMLEGLVLRQTVAFYNATNNSDISIYVYAYEAWDD